MRTFVIAVVLVAAPFNYECFEGTIVCDGQRVHHVSDRYVRYSGGALDIGRTGKKVDDVGSCVAYPDTFLTLTDIALSPKSVGAITDTVVITRVVVDTVTVVEQKEPHKPNLPLYGLGALLILFGGTALILRVRQ